MSLLDDDDEEEARQRPPPKMRAPPAPATKLPPKAKSRLGRPDGGRRQAFTAITAKKDIGCEDSEGERR
jgi:hypothetical protein